MSKRTRCGDLCSLCVDYAFVILKTMNFDIKGFGGWTRCGLRCCFLSIVTEILLRNDALCTTHDGFCI